MALDGFQILFSFTCQNGILRAVRRRLLHLGIALILGLCLWGHVSELFDHWENTFQTGKDIEYSTVIVALVTGAVICCVHLVAIRSRTTITHSLPLPVEWSAAVPAPAFFVAHSPPALLRI